MRESELAAVLPNSPLLIELDASRDTVSDGTGVDNPLAIAVFVGDGGLIVLCVLSFSFIPPTTGWVLAAAPNALPKSPPKKELFGP